MHVAALSAGLESAGRKGLSRLRGVLGDFLTILEYIFYDCFVGLLFEHILNDEWVYGSIFLVIRNYLLG